MDDILFSTIERWSNASSRKWGRFLDAGTGSHSLKWIQNLNTDSWTAITADEKMKQQILESGVTIRPVDSILVGNWMSNEFCSQLGTYDTILADYLFGAVDGFSPYTQDIIIDKYVIHSNYLFILIFKYFSNNYISLLIVFINRLRMHLNPGGRLYIVGMNPIPDHSNNYAAEVVTEVRRARDACILLAGHRPYRYTYCTHTYY